MAMGIPAQPGPLTPSFSSHPRLLSSPLCRSQSGTTWMLCRPFRRSNRYEFRSLQRLGANNSGIDSYGSLKAMQPSGMTTRLAVMSSGMHIIHHARFCSSQSSYPKLVSTFNIINMPRTEEESKPNFGVSGWVQETVKFQISRTTHQLCRNIAKGQIPLQVLEHDYILEKEKVDFGVILDRSAYEGEVSTYPHELLVNKITKPQPARHNLATNTHRQSELTTTQTVREGIHLKGSRSLKPLGDLKITANDTSFSNSTINDHCIRSSIEKAAPPKECSMFVGASHDTIITNDTNFSNFSINGHCIKSSIEKTIPLEECGLHKEENQDKLVRIYDKVLVVDNPSAAKEVVQVLTTTYKNSIHACDTEVANIDVKQETPVGHGEIICFSIYSGPQTDFGNGKSCIWVDVLDGGRDVLMAFAPFFEDPSIKKVWHNYSFDSHVIENYGIKLSGFHADTMHLARLWDSSRRTGGGYSLEALTSDPRVMAPNRKNNQRGMPRTQSCPDDEVIFGKMSMKSIFGKNKVKKDGSEGKLVTVAPVEMLQRGEERIQWICYSALDSISTWKLFNSLKENIMTKDWVLDGVSRGTMYDFYEEYWRPFGVLLVKMESEGMLVDRAHLSGIEKVAIAEQQLVADRFRKWASKYCPDAKYMNVGSDTQLRQLFFGGIQNRKDINETLPDSKTFKVPNIESVSGNGMKTSSKYRTITLNTLGVKMQTEIYTPSGWPSVSGDALKALAGKLSTDQFFLMDYENGFHSDCSKESLSDQTDVEEDESEKLNASSDDTDTSTYGTAYLSFGGGKEGKEACHAIAALCEVCSIDSLISNFILPLQGNHISGKNGRVHCSLNINTETGRLSARRPNLQNQPALEKDRYKIRQAFIAKPGNSLIVADYGQLELRILAHLASCKSMLDAFKAGGDFHSRTAMNMYSHVREAVEDKRVLLEWHPQPGEDKPPVPLLKDAFAAERRKAKMLNFSIAYGKTPIGLSRDWKVSVREGKETVKPWYENRKEVLKWQEARKMVTVKEAKETVKLWYKNREEVLEWQETRKIEAREKQRVYTLLGRARDFPSMASVSNAQKGHIERAAINAPVQGSAADVAMCAMLEIDRNIRLKELGWKLLLQVHDEVILEGPSESAEIAKALVVECMSKPFYGTNFLKVDLSVDAKCAQNWYAAK